MRRSSSEYPQFLKRISFAFFVVTTLLISCGGSGNSSGDDDSGDEDTNTAEIFNRSDIQGNLKFLLPFASGESFDVWQGYGGTFSHSEACYYYSLDFGLPEGTDVVAVADGRVIFVKEDSNVNGTTLEYWDDSNYVTVDHGDGYYSSYVHICQNCVDVEVGDVVAQGDVMARSGNTGYSTDPHLHFAVYSWATGCTVPYGFYDVPDEGGIAEVDQSYLSRNAGQSTDEYLPSEVPLEYFASNGVTLTQSLPWVIDRGETYEVSGSVTNGQAKVALFVMDLDGNWMDGVTGNVNNGVFTLSFTVSSDLEAGRYYIALATSNTDYFYTEYSLYAWVE